MRTARSVAVAVAASVAIGMLVWGEYEHWQSSRRGVASPPADVADEVVVVLGFRNLGDRANLINRYRVRAGLRSRDRSIPSSILVLCGGPTAGPTPESTLMSRYARDELGYTGDVRVEAASRSTWENIRNVLPVIESAGQIKIVSNSIHAEKGRAYLSMLRPDLADRMVRADEYRFGELTLLKPLLATVGLTKLRHHKRRNE